MADFVLNMVEHARLINEHIDDNFPVENREARQVICLAEEGGEFLEAAIDINTHIGRFIGAWRRYSGNARRTGTKEDALKELADVIVVAYVTADILTAGGPNIHEIIAHKLEDIYSRGWRQWKSSTTEDTSTSATPPQQAPESINSTELLGPLPDKCPNCGED